ncbi:MAG: NTP transferase domain-containing protein, partial [Pseudomonadales bacterium]|nr:NTP transferase domain-containing protein [Pseudomonadales bacterium]
MSVEVVVLAAGAGTRMRSAMPKVLHPLGGRPLLAHVLDTVRSLEPSRIHVVVGEQSELVEACFADYPGLSWALQESRQGTGHAVGKALPAVSDDATVLVLFGDAPFTAKGTMVGCVE